ncbi:hypothetical protein ACTXT7_014631 [Hymenolepis weldensis]
MFAGVLSVINRQHLYNKAVYEPRQSHFFVNCVSNGFVYGSLDEIKVFPFIQFFTAAAQILIRLLAKIMMSVTVSGNPNSHLNYYKTEILKKVDSERPYASVPFIMNSETVIMDVLSKDCRKPETTSYELRPKLESLKPRFFWKGLQELRRIKFLHGQLATYKIQTRFVLKKLRNFRRSIVNRTLFKFVQCLVNVIFLLRGDFAPVLDLVKDKFAAVAKTKIVVRTFSLDSFKYDGSYLRKFAIYDTL